MPQLNIVIRKEGAFFSNNKFSVKVKLKLLGTSKASVLSTELTVRNSQFRVMTMTDFLCNLRQSIYLFTTPIKYG